MVAISNPSPDPTAGKPPRRRRSIPLSLRIFVWINLFVGISGGLWVGIPAYQQRTAIRGIERPNVLIDARRGSQEWMRPWLGKEQMKMFDQVVKVILADATR